MDARLQKCCMLGCWQYQGKQEKGRRRGRLKLENICNFQIVSAFRLRKRRQAHLSFNMCLLYLCFVFVFAASRLSVALVHIEEDSYWISSHDDILMSCSSKKELNQRIHFYRANFHYILLTCWGAFKIFELAVLRHQSARKDTKLPHITIICKNHEFIMTFSIPRGFLLLLGFSLYLESI